MEDELKINDLPGLKKLDDSESHKVDGFRRIIFKKAFFACGFNKETLNDKLRELNNLGPYPGKFTHESVAFAIEWLVEDYMPHVCEEYHNISKNEALPEGEESLTREQMADSVLKATVRSAREGKPASQLAAGKMLGMITEKQEIKHELKYEPEYYLSFGRKVIEQLRDDYRRYGVCSVCGDPLVLLGEVREDKGQDQGNHTLPVVDAPDIPF